MQQLYQGKCALHTLAGGAWVRAGVGWCVLQLVQTQPGQFQLIGRDSANPESVRMQLSCVRPCLRALKPNNRGPCHRYF